MSARQIDKKTLIKVLKEYFSGKEDVVMAFLFGSSSKGTTHLESDVDVAVYFTKELNDDDESAIWSDIEKIIGTNVDFIVLNRAFPLIADSALKGIPIVIKNRDIYLNFLLKTVSEAIDYRTFVESFWLLKQRRTHGS